MVRSIAFLTALVAGCACLAAQDAAPHRIGVLLWHRSPNDLQALEGIRHALAVAGTPHELIVAEADSDEARAEELLQGFVAQELDLVIALGTQAALLAKEHVRELPVVFTAVTNPVESGVVASWQGSGTNLAGNSNWIPPETLVGVFRRAVPGLGKLGILRSRATGVVSAAELAGVRRHLANLRPHEPPIEILEEVVDDADELAAAVGRLAEAGADAVWIPIDFLVYENMEPVLRTAAAHRLPLVSSSLRGVASGAVAGVVVDYEMLGERAALIVLDVLERGRDPGALPIGTMRSYRVVVNLAAARRLGYELPLPLLALADELLDATPPEAGR